MGVKINERFKGITGHLKFTYRNAKTDKTRVSEYDNIIVDTCFNMLAKRLSGIQNDCNITFGAVGDDNTAPTSTDTILTNETARAAVTSATVSANQTIVSVFYNTTVANGTIAEFGLFGEAATSAADTGTMINHALVTETKTATETLTIDITITIT
ncbi:hypothetical protein LCGC14_1498470 [marine sediment metagenome]|uniref:Uncharacterized protein n=1 Tax=marine sediment metagenome TaxID=412755 RepID=A0A0F9LKF9_9ZZZZ